MTPDKIADTLPITNGLPVVRKIQVSDLRPILAKGVEDFREWPTHLVLIALIYPIIGLFLARLTAGYDLLPLFFSLAAGFALIAPLAALGLYELSRLRETHDSVSWKRAFDVFRSHSIAAIERLALVLVTIFFAWLFTAQLIYEAVFDGFEPTSVSAFLRQVFLTSQGWSLIGVGGGVGLLFALVVFSIIVVSFPLLLDRDTSASIAVSTSVRVVLVNPIPMLVWGSVVAGGLVLGSLPAFVGLAIIMPILGHSTWHLYRKVVEP